MLYAVPCSGADRVVLIDADAGQRRGGVDVGRHPVHLARVDDRVFVATMGERSITAIVDGSVRRVDLGVLGPSHFGTLAETLLVPCTGGDTLAVVDPVALSSTGRVPVGAEPHDVAVHEGRAFVGSRADGTVSVVDPDDWTVSDTHRIDTDARIQGVAGGPEGVYAVDQAGATVSLLDADGVRATATVGSDPYDLVVAESGIYVPGRADGTVTALDPGLSDPVVHDAGGRPVDVVEAAGTTWVLDRDRSGLRSLEGDLVPTPHPGISLASHPASPERVLVSHYDAAAVSSVDLGAGQTRWTVETPEYPFEAIPV